MDTQVQENQKTIPNRPRSSEWHLNVDVRPQEIKHKDSKRKTQRSRGGTIVARTENQKSILRYCSILQILNLNV